jgi:hypothetical protein
MFIALFVDLALFIVDAKNGWLLHRVDKGTTIQDLITSPLPEERRQIA